MATQRLWQTLQSVQGEPASDYTGAHTIRRIFNALLPKGGLQEPPSLFLTDNFFRFQNYAPCFYVFLNRWQRHILLKTGGKPHYRGAPGSRVVSRGTYLTNIGKLVTQG